jgi:hypothetical protein
MYRAFADAKNLRRRPYGGLMLDEIFSKNDTAFPSANVGYDHDTVPLCSDSDLLPLYVVSEEF